MTKPNAKHTAVLFTVISMAVATLAVAETRQAIGIWECFNLGDTSTIAVKAWAYSPAMMLDKDYQLLYDNGKILMNGISKQVGYSITDQFEHMWIIPTLMLHADGTTRKGQDYFLIDAIGVGKHEVQGETRFTVQCKRQH